MTDRSRTRIPARAIAGAWLLACAACVTNQTGGVTIARYELIGIAPAATGDEILVNFEAYDAASEYVPFYSYRTRGATCDLAGCSVTADDSEHLLHIRSDNPGLAHIVVTVEGSHAPAPPMTLDVPFRKPTKIMVQRTLRTGTAGSAWAMLLGETQRWLIAPGDDQGVLAGSAQRFKPLYSERDHPEGITCIPEGMTDFARRYGGRAAYCTVAPRAPGDYAIDIDYDGIPKRHEVVHVVAVEDVVRAELLSCRSRSYREPLAKDGSTFEELVPAESRDLPCETVTDLALPSGDCPSAREVLLVPKLVTKNGVEVLGGGDLLARDGHASEPVDPYALARDGTAGTLRGKFGTASLVVPFSGGHACE